MRCYTDKLSTALTEGAYSQSSNSCKRTHPLLFPFTLCSEKVMSLWSMLMPRLSATCRRSSSVVHCKRKSCAERIYPIVSEIPHTWLEKHKRVQTHCRSPMYSASWPPPPAPPAPIPAATAPFIWPLWLLPPPVYTLPFCGPEGAAGVDDASDLMPLPSWASCCCSESSSSLSRFSPTTGECEGAASEVPLSSVDT